MRNVCYIGIALVLSGCGYSQRDGEAVGQAKKVTTVTPLICPDYVAFDLSLGVMRNGSGSMSTQDIWFTVYDVVDVVKMKAAVAASSIVRVKYDTRRVAFCTESNIATGFEVVP